MEQKPETQAASARELVQLTNARSGILGIKAGMTQVYTESGDSVAVTIIDLKPAVITQLKTKETDGYQGVQVGFLEKKAKSATKPEQGHVKKSGATGFYHYQEFRLADTDTLDGLTVGKVLSAEFVKPGDLVDVSAVSKGKGFQGGMKRFHMAGGHKTHGASVSHRSLGSIGQRADPGKCPDKWVTFRELFRTLLLSVSMWRISFSLFTAVCRDLAVGSLPCSAL
jgi:large subunit ribosomal protein L3